MDVIERLREAVKDSGYQRKKVAERAGMKAAKLTKILSGRQAVTVGDFIAIASAIGRDPSHLISEKDVVVGLGDLQSAHRAAQETERILASILPAARAAGTPLFPKRKPDEMVRPIRAAASSNVELLAEVEAKKVHVPRDARNRGAKLVARAIGDSMEGAGGFHDGQLVFLQPTRSRRSATGKIVVCRLDDAIYLKQLTGTGRSATLISINPAHPAIEVPDANRIEIYGIVVWPVTD